MNQTAARWVRVLGVGLALGLVARMLWAVAWQCDDAYITHKMAWNLANGYGMVWNAGERVQAFTHPLWFGVSTLCHVVFGEVFFSLLAVSAVLVVATLAGVVRLARQPAFGWVAASLLSASGAFVEFGVSGLENPLTYVLLLLSVVVAERAPDHRRLVLLGLLVSGLFLSRPDAPVFVAPLVLHAWWTTPGRLRGIGALALGAVPMLAWELFSLVWFGAFVPNTAIAKLNLQLSREALVDQGLWYLADAFGRDAIAALLCFGGAGLALALGRGPLKALGAGLLAYLAYVAWIGGDFMSMRFVAAPTVLGAALLSRVVPPLGTRRVAMLAGAVVLAGVLAPTSPWLDDGRYADDWAPHDRLRPRAIGNERAFYAPQSRASWVWANRERIRANGHPIPPYDRSIEAQEVRRKGYKVVTAEQLGFFAYVLGPDVWVVDRLALADPFLARIPYSLESDNWRIGHFERKMPEGYAAMAASGVPAFGDPEVDAAFRAVTLVTRGPLFAPERWQAIWDLQTGVYAPAFAKLAGGVDRGPWPVAKP